MEFLHFKDAFIIKKWFKWGVQTLFLFLNESDCSSEIPKHKTVLNALKQAQNWSSAKSPAKTSGSLFPVSLWPNGDR